MRNIPFAVAADKMRPSGLLRHLGLQEGKLTTPIVGKRQSRWQGVIFLVIDFIFGDQTTTCLRGCMATLMKRISNLQSKQK